jgi:hypothetical protein
MGHEVDDSTVVGPMTGVATLQAAHYLGVLKYDSVPGSRQARFYPYRRAVDSPADAATSCTRPCGLARCQPARFNASGLRTCRCTPRTSQSHTPRMRPGTHT